MGKVPEAVRVLIENSFHVSGPVAVPDLGFAQVDGVSVVQANTFRRPS